VNMSRESKLIVLVAVLASLLEIIDTSIVNVAIPTMMGNLGATLEDISMVITGYAIANAIVLPLSAWMGERLGRRRYFIGCIAMFTVTSVACGVAPNLTTLIIFRIFQGFFGGALLPTSQALIYEQFPKEKAGIAGALFGMSVMIGPTLGPTLGGFLTDNFGWRSIFNINLPLGIFAVFVGYLVVKDTEKAPGSQNHAKAPIDILGLMLITVGIGCLQYVLERGESDDWFASKVITTCAVLAVTSLPAFVWWELRIPNPIINIRLFKKSVVSIGVMLMSALGFFLYSLVLILPVFVGRLMHYTATQTGTLFIPGALLTALMMPFVGRQVGKRDPRLLIGIGLIAVEACVLYMTTFSVATGRDEILTALYIRGFGMAFLFVPINSTILSQFKGVELGQVSGLLNLSRQIGGSIGIALVATLLSMKSHQNYADLRSKVSALSPAAQQTYAQITGGMASKMSTQVGDATSAAAAAKLLAFRMDNQVFMLSFLQLMWLIAIMFSAAAVPLYFLKIKNRPVNIVDAH
jgi:MFS transporter, DHA2 family, multidrug resistance protein